MVHVSTCLKLVYSYFQCLFVRYIKANFRIITYIFSSVFKIISECLLARLRKSKQPRSCVLHWNVTASF